ncbi:MAG: exostosin family protein [Bacteroidota bacterium]
MPKSTSNSVAKAVEETNMAVYQEGLSAGRPVVLFFRGDRSHEPTPFTEAITFREGLYVSHKGVRDYCMPAFSEDIAYQVPNTVQGQRRNSLTFREKNNKATISFCGLAPKPKLNDYFKDYFYYLYTFLRQGYFDVSPNYGERLRHQAIKLLHKSETINTNFILRDKSVFLGNPDPIYKRQTRQEFIQNIVNSDYVLCCRGSGNYSYRVYETLCMGRIPVIVSPDGQLPYEFHIDWKDYCLFVEETNLQSISELICEHYDALTPDAYQERQLACRKIWEDYLSPEGFFRHLSLHIDN